MLILTGVGPASLLGLLSLNVRLGHSVSSNNTGRFFTPRTLFVIVTGFCSTGSIICCSRFGFIKRSRIDECEILYLWRPTETCRAKLKHATTEPMCIHISDMERLWLHVYFIHHRASTFLERRYWLQKMVIGCVTDDEIQYPSYPSRNL